MRGIPIDDLTFNGLYRELSYFSLKSSPIALIPTFFKITSLANEFVEFNLNRKIKITKIEKTKDYLECT